MWLEEKIGDRINQTRFAQLEASGTSDVAVACPYCWSMLSDAQQETGREAARTWDVIELVAQALPSGTGAPRT
jgi:Fe-S oxidoreductase